MSAQPSPRAFNARRRRSRELALPLLSALVLCGCEQGSSSNPGSTTSAGASTAIAVGPVPGPVRDLQSPSNPLAENPRARQQGRELFVAFNCSGCHGGHGGGGMGPSLRDARWSYGASDAQIYDSIAAGRANGMPAWGSLLPQEEIWKLVAYIQSMRTADEPNAPR